MYIDKSEAHVICNFNCIIENELATGSHVHSTCDDNWDSRFKI